MKNTSMKRSMVLVAGHVHPEKSCYIESRRRGDARVGKLGVVTSARERAN